MRREVKIGVIVVFVVVGAALLYFTFKSNDQTPTETPPDPIAKPNPDSETTPDPATPPNSNSYASGTDSTYGAGTYGTYRPPYGSAGTATTPPETGGTSSAGGEAATVGASETTGSTPYGSTPYGSAGSTGSTGTTDGTAGTSGTTADTSGTTTGTYGTTTGTYGTTTGTYGTTTGTYGTTGGTSGTETAASGYEATSDSGASSSAGMGTYGTAGTYEAYEAPSVTVPTTSGNTYTVTADDSGGFWGIAKKKYGDGKWHWLIAKANPKVHSRSLSPGTVLKTPPLPATVAASGVALPTTGTIRPLASGAREYIVAKGDNFWTLANKHLGHGKYMDRIAAANPGIKSSSLKVGQKIILPERPATGSTGTATAGATTTGTSTSLVAGFGQKVYTIAKNDNLSTIAKRNYGSASLYPAILKLNPGLNPRRLRVGKKILLPSKAEAQAATARPTPSTPTVSGGTGAATASTTSTGSGRRTDRPYFD